MLATVYDAAFARLAEDGGAAALLVGDTVGPVALGLSSAEDVTFETMRHHAAAVKRGARTVPVIADVPLSTATLATSDAADRCRRFVEETKIDAMKLEGASANVLDLTERLSRAGTSVVAHLERSEATEAAAQRVAGAGAIAIVLVAADATIAARITRALAIPTIGKGSGSECDAQVVNLYQALGIAGTRPSLRALVADEIAAATR